MKHLTLQRLNIIAIIAALCALADTTFFSARSEQISFAVRHLGGIYEVLYVFPVATLAVAIMALCGRLRGVEWWYLSISASGFLLPIIAILAAMGAAKTVEALNLNETALREAIRSKGGVSWLACCASVAINGMVFLSFSEHCWGVPKRLRALAYG
jgi:fucose 4-O-acetylase-like acetyltransferase